MRAAFLSIIFITIATFSFSQPEESDLYGKWVFSELMHFGADKNVDIESSNHYGRMLAGRTFIFKPAGIIEISGYTDCAWKLDDNFLLIRYGKEGNWEKEEVMKYGAFDLILRSEVDFPEENNVQVTKYSRILD